MTRTAIPRPAVRQLRATHDNSDRTCHALDQRSEGELTLVGTCSLCGARIELWPCRQDRCERCLARVEHV